MFNTQCKLLLLCKDSGMAVHDEAMLDKVTVVTHAAGRHLVPQECGGRHLLSMAQLRCKLHLMQHCMQLECSGLCVRHSMASAASCKQLNQQGVQATS